MNEYKLERRLNDSVSEIIGHVEDLEGIISGKEDDIKALNDIISDKDDEIDRLKEIISSMDDEIGNLHKELNEKSKAQEQVQY